MKTYTATRAGTADALPVGRYICTRCGIERKYHTGHPKPARCADCRAVECGKGHIYGHDPSPSGGCRQCAAERVERRRAEREAARLAQARQARPATKEKTA